MKALLDLITDGKIASNRGGIDIWSLARELAGHLKFRPDLHETIRYYARDGVGPAKAIAIMTLAKAPTSDDLLLTINLYVADEYGAPKDECRHPDIASNRPWPLKLR